MTGDFTEFEELRSCPVCRSPGPFPAPFEKVARCPACRVYFGNPRPTQKEIAASYESGTTYDSWIPERMAREAHWKISHLAFQMLIDAPQHFEGFDLYHTL